MIPAPIPVPTVTYAHDRMAPCPPRAISDKAGAVTSVSIWTRTAGNRRLKNPSTSVRAQPGLGVARMLPYLQVSRHASCSVR